MNSSAFQPFCNIGGLRELDKSPEEREAPVDIEPIIGDEQRPSPELSAGIFEDQSGLSPQESLEELRAEPEVELSHKDMPVNAEDEGVDSNEATEVHSEPGSVFAAGSREVDESGSGVDQRQNRHRDGSLLTPSRASH